MVSKKDEAKRKRDAKRLNDIQTLVEKRIADYQQTWKECWGEDLEISDEQRRYWIEIAMESIKGSELRESI